MALSQFSAQTLSLLLEAARVKTTPVLESNFPILTLQTETGMETVSKKLHFCSKVLHYCPELYFLAIHKAMCSTGKSQFGGRGKV